MWIFSFRLLVGVDINSHYFSVSFILFFTFRAKPSPLRYLMSLISLHCLLVCFPSYVTNGASEICYIYTHIANQFFIFDHLKELSLGIKNWLKFSLKRCLKTALVNRQKPIVLW